MYTAGSYKFVKASIRKITKTVTNFTSQNSTDENPSETNPNDPETRQEANTSRQLQRRENDDFLHPSTEGLLSYECPPSIKRFLSPAFYADSKRFLKWKRRLCGSRTPHPLPEVELRFIRRRSRSNSDYWRIHAVERDIRLGGKVAENRPFHSLETLPPRLDRYDASSYSMPDLRSMTRKSEVPSRWTPIYPG